MTAYNLRIPAVKVLMKEAQELRNSTELYHAQPLEDNLFEWHFTIRGSADSDFAEGIYHGRILFPSEYPLKPPDIILLTPNGRFSVNEKICLSISGFHPESWQPSWSIRTVLLAIIGFMPSSSEGALGSLDYTPDERRRLAKESLKYFCSVCKLKTAEILKPLTEESKFDANQALELGNKLNINKKFEAVQPSNETASDTQTKSTLDENASELRNRRESEYEEGQFVESAPSVENCDTKLFSSSFFGFLFSIVSVFFIIRQMYIWTHPTLDF